MMSKRKYTYEFRRLEEQPPSSFCAHPSRTSVLRWMSFTSAFLAICAAFSMFAFTVYLDPLKSQFRLTQSQVELFMSLEWLGMGFTLPGGYMIKRFGIRWGGVMALILSVIPHLLIWLACDRETYYNQHYGLLAFYFLLAGCGSSLTYLVAMTATVGNFPEKSRCTILSLLSSGTSIGPMLYIAVYDAFFYVQPDEPLYTILSSNSSIHNYTNYLKNENITDHNPKNTGDRQDVGAYFLLVSVTFILANALSIIFHGDYPPETEDSDSCRSRTDSAYSDEDAKIDSRSSASNSHNKLTITSSSSDEGYYNDQTAPSPNKNLNALNRVGDKYLREQNEISPLLQKLKHCKRLENVEMVDKSLKDILYSPLFHFIAWPSVVLLGLGPMNANNLNTFLISMGLTEYIVSLPMVSVWSGIIGKVLIGYISDKVIHAFPRGGFLFLGCIISTLTYALCMVALEHVSIVILNQVVCNIGAVVVWGLMPSVIIEEFGDEHFVLLWGTVQLFYGIAAFSLQYMLGAFYDVQLQSTSNDDLTTCFGQLCFTWTFLVCSILCAVSSVLSGFYIRQRIQHFVCYKERDK